MHKKHLDFDGQKIKGMQKRLLASKIHVLFQYFSGQKQIQTWAISRTWPMPSTEKRTQKGSPATAMSYV